jgi:hypothetical protein
MTGAVVTIDHALEAFLAAQRERLSERTFRNYDHVVELLRDSLNGYAYDTLGADDRARWEAAFEAGDEDAYCHLFGPDHIPAHLGGFLGYFMIRKVMAGEELLRAAGTVTKRLAKWLRDEGLINAEQAADAADRGAAATRDLPRAERLGNLLYEEAQRLPDFDPADVPDEHVIEDYLAIERVEPGALWFEGDVGPVPVPTEASDLAEPGWSVNIVLVMLRGRWHVAEVGFVYP